MAKVRASRLFAGFLLLASCLLSMTSCERDLPLYDTDTCRLNFYYGLASRANYKESLSHSSYSFVYGDASRQRDTLWFEVETMGFVSDKDRPVALEQISGEGENAVPGTHYVPFNDPSLASLYVIPAGKARTKLPVVVLRDASLKSETVTLTFTIKANDYFVQGYPEYTTRVLDFTDQLAEPSRWNYDYPTQWAGYFYHFSDYFGAYGLVKHQFLIEQSGNKWDDEYIDSLMNGDGDYLMYICKKMSKRLKEVNAERVAQGLDVLKEADGTVVEIEYPY